MDTSSLFHLGRDFYTRDVLEVAPGLLGKIFVNTDASGRERACRITETEAYRGSCDLACHASKGRTARTEIMFHRGGHLYIYLIYGIHWMLNIVTSTENVPQAVLIRGVESYPGPGKLTAGLGIDKSYYGIDLVRSTRAWIGDDGYRPGYRTSTRIGIDYAGSPWKEKPWRYLLNDERQTTKG